MQVEARDYNGEWTVLEHVSPETAILIKRAQYFFLKTPSASQITFNDRVRVNR